MICWVSEVLIFIEDIIEQSNYSLDFYYLILVRSNIYNFATAQRPKVKEGGFRSGTIYILIGILLCIAGLAISFRLHDIDPDLALLEGFTTLFSQRIGGTRSGVLFRSDYVIGRQLSLCLQFDYRA